MAVWMEKKVAANRILMGFETLQHFLNVLFWFCRDQWICQKLKRKLKTETIGQHSTSCLTSDLCLITANVLMDKTVVSLKYRKK